MEETWSEVLEARNQYRYLLLWYNKLLPTPSSRKRKKNGEKQNSLSQRHYVCQEFEGSSLAEAGLWVFPKVGVKYCLEPLSPESLTETGRATFGMPPSQYPLRPRFLASVLLQDVA